MTPLTTTEFRALFPAFADDTAYPDATVTIWLGLAVDMVSDAWGNMAQTGQGLWAAHMMANLASAAQQAAAGNPTGIGGIVQSKSVGPASVSYDTQLGTEDGAGMYNGTDYGRKYIHFARLFGMGPLQIGPAVAPPFGMGTFSGRAWVGPPPFPGVFG